MTATVYHAQITVGQKFKKSHFTTILEKIDSDEIIQIFAQKNLVEIQIFGGKIKMRQF